MDKRCIFCEKDNQTRSWIENYFNKLRFDKNHHLGLGDIRLTIGQQEEIIKCFNQSSPTQLKGKE